MTDTIYIIEMPNKPAREITGINFDKVAERVEAAGGKIYPKPIAKSTPYIQTPTHIVKTKHNTYSYSEALAIARHIAEQHFSNCKDVHNIPICIGRRTTKTLGYVKMKYVYSDNFKKTKVPVEMVLSQEIVNGKSSDKLHQVIYHEFCHVEFPNDGHRGWGFRYKEINNPYRIKRSLRLTCVS